jgi:peptidoglycan-associated lipoprotein
MWVCPKNKKLVIAITVGMLMASGCSGHSVKYGANSEGEVNGQGEEEIVGSIDYPTRDARNYGGDTFPGGMVNGNDPYLRGNSLNPQSDGGINKEPETPPQSDGVDYGHEYPGVDGSGPNHGPVTGFGNGSAESSNPDPETWANAYLRNKNSSREFYGDPSQAGSLSVDGPGEIADYGDEYEGVPGSGPRYGEVDGFSKGSASPTSPNPETWAQAYVKENGGPSPEYVNPETNIAQPHGAQNGGSAEIRKSSASGNGNLSNDVTPGFQGSVQDIYFGFDSWSISPVAAEYLAESAEWLHANPEKALMIEGHCDQRGTGDYNLVLGQKRAEAARAYLVALGVQPNRIKIVSYGKERPFCHSDNEACFQENRRNHMVVRMNLS